MSLRTRWVLPAVVSALALAPGRGRAEDPAPAALFDVVLFDAAAPDAKLPKAQGAGVRASSEGGKFAAVIAVPGGAAWGRAWWGGTPKDVQAFAHLDLEIRQDVGEPVGCDLSLADGGERSAVVKLPPLKTEWETRRVALGDLNPEPGFDPADVKMLTLTWRKPAGLQVAVAKVTFVPGAGGWRHPPEEQMKRIFGAQRAREVKHETTAHFEVYTDSAKALTALGAALEKDAEAIALQLGAGKDALAGFKLPVYAFKQASDYQDYCVRTLGMSQELARSYTATGTAWALVMVAQTGSNPGWRHRLGRAIQAHLYGSGGGAWFHDGAAEYCVRRLEDRPVAKEMASRIKAGTHWTLAELVGASRLHAASGQTDASYDHRPVYLHAASVMEYLLRVPPAEPAADDASARIQARLRALGQMQEQGRARVEALPKVLGVASLEELEAAWKKWVPTAGR